MPIGVSIKSACNGIFVSRTRRTFSIEIRVSMLRETPFRSLAENAW